MTNILAFFQRLTSPIGESNVKQAWLEFGLAVTAATGLVTSFKAKDWSSIFQQGEGFYAALIGLVASIRFILSSNEKGIQNPALPKVTGTVNLN